MTILIDLSVAGINTGPFNLYSNADAYASAFATNITRQQLLDGYPAVVLNGTTNIKLQSLNDICPNDTILPVITTTSTTSSTSTSTSTSTTTTTTTAAPLTTTTTTVAPTIFIPDGSLSASCNSTSGGGTTVTKRFLINVTNPPNPYTTGVSVTTSTGGSHFVSIYTNPDNGLQYVQVVFNTSAGVSASVVVRLSLRDQSAQEVAYSSSTIYNDYYSSIPNCVF